MAKEPIITTLHDTKGHKDKGSYQVTMSNALAKSSHGLGLDEKRLITLAIAQIDSRKPPSLNPVLFRVGADEFAKTYKTSPKSSYRQIRDAGRKLIRSIITFSEGTEKNEVITEIPWLTKAKYKEGEGWIELAFNDELIPHLMSLKEKFGSYKLDQSKALRKSYSWRILELMMAHKKERSFKMTPVEFMKAIDAPKSYGAAQLKQRIITPAQKEISANSGWVLYVSYRKSKRRIGLIIFEFEPQKQMDFFDK